MASGGVSRPDEKTVAPGPAFRVGATSFVRPDGIVPNVRYLAGRVDDVELLLFEVDDPDRDLPGREEVDELRSLAVAHALGYTVHLPLDLELGGGARWSRDVDLACRVVEATEELDPWAWIVHVEIPAATRRETFEDRAVEALERIAAVAGDGRRLAVENLEGVAPGALDRVVARAGVSRCVDVGHLWLDGHSAVAYLEAALERTRVLHVHGVGVRDHASLAEQDIDQVVDVLEVLLRRSWDGVLTLEVFGDEELASSQSSLAAALVRAGRRVRVA